MCDHNTVIEDQHTGDLVCSDCAFVLGPVYTAPSSGKRDLTWSSSTLMHHVTSDKPPGRAMTCTEHLSPPLSFDCKQEERLYLDGAQLRLRETVLDVCGQLHLEQSPCLVDTVCHILHQLETQPSMFRLTSEKCRAKLAYALYEALNRQGTPRSPRSIAAYCDVSPKSLLHVEKLFSMQTTYCVPSQYIETACTMLQLPYVVSCISVMLCNYVQDRHYGSIPETLVAASIWATVKRIRILEKDESLFPWVTTEAFTALFGITARSLIKVTHLLPEFTVVLVKNSSEESEQRHEVLERKKWSERKYDYWINSN